MNALRAPADPTDDAAGAWEVESLRFAPRNAPPPGWRMQHVAIGIGVAALHLLFWWIVEVQSRGDALEAAKQDVAIVVTFIETLPRQVIRAERPPVPATRAARPERAEVDPRPRTSPRPSTRPVTAADAPLQLYLPDGSLRLPDNLADPLAAERQFDFRMPDLDQAARLLDRPPALVYEPTRFDEYWAPQEDLLSEVLRKAVEKTSTEVRIPIPGSKGRYLVCRVSLLAAGGACGVERNGGNDVVSLDDSKTLSPVEAAACAAWWDRIVGAATQSEWRATRQLYEAECRKPLAKAPPEAKPAPEPAQ
jgi:hypothetical protein